MFARGGGGDYRHDFFTVAAEPRTPVFAGCCMGLIFRKRAFPAESLRIARRAACDRSPAVLRRWSDIDIELALWNRRFDPSVTSALDRLAFSELPRACFITTLDDVEQDIERALRERTADQAHVYDALGADIESLVVRFSQVTGAREIKLRLEGIRNDACRLFHFDRVNARLVTTYIGPGMEWIPSLHAADALAAQDAYKGPIYQMSRFAVGVFRGALSQRKGLLHRSPRIAETGQHRLLLCLNQAI